MKYFIAFTLFFFINCLAPAGISAITNPKTNVAHSVVFSAKQLNFSTHLVLKYLSMSGKRNKKAIDGFFIAGFLFVALGVVLSKTSVGFSGILGALSGLICLIFGGLLILTAVILTFMN